MISSNLSHHHFQQILASFEERIHLLGTELQSAFKTLGADEASHILSKDPTTAHLVSLRFVEIIEGSFLPNLETHSMKLLAQNST